MELKKNLADEYIPDINSTPTEQDAPFVYRTGNKGEYKLLTARPVPAVADANRFGNWLIALIFAWLVILGALSLFGFEIEAEHFFITFIASVIFASLVVVLQSRRSKSSRS